MLFKLNGKNDANQRCDTGAIDKKADLVGQQWMMLRNIGRNSVRIYLPIKAFVALRYTG